MHNYNFVRSLFLPLLPSLSEINFTKEKSRLLLDILSIKQSSMFLYSCFYPLDSAFYMEYKKLPQLESLQIDISDSCSTPQATSQNEPIVPIYCSSPNNISFINQCGGQSIPIIHIYWGNDEKCIQSSMDQMLMNNLNSYSMNLSSRKSVYDYSLISYQSVKSLFLREFDPSMLSFQSFLSLLHNYCLETKTSLDLNSIFISSAYSPNQWFSSKDSAKNSTWLKFLYSNNIQMHHYQLLDKPRYDKKTSSFIFCSHSSFECL